MRTKKLKTHLPIPKVLKSSNTKTLRDFPIDSYSYSSLSLFTTNPILFKIKYINRDRIDTLRGISAVVGSAFHNALFEYYTEMTISNGFDPVKAGLEAGTKYIEEYEDGWIQYTTTIPTKQKALEKFTYAFTSYVQEIPYDPEKRAILSLEERLEEKVAVEWRGQKVALPVTLVGYLDKLEEDKEKGMIITDYKLVHAFSSPDKIDGSKILQAVQYYFLVYAAYGTAPYSIIFEEVKHSKNRDGGKQVQRYEMVYEQCEQFFDFYLRLYDDVTRAIGGEAVWVPNINALYDNEVALVSYIHRLDVSEEAAAAMKKERVTNITDLLKRKIVNATSMKRFMETVERQFVSGKQLNYTTMRIEEKIKTKFMEFGMLLDFEDVITGNAVDLYRFTPSIRLKMSNLKSYVADIEQVVGVSGVRILAPIPNTTLVGFEIPRAERTFPEGLPALDQANPFRLAMGVDILKQVYTFDIRKAPHLLIAGATGSGKSVFLNSLLEQLKENPQVDLHLFDPKMVELVRYKKHALEYENNPEAIYESLMSIANEMESRYARLAEAGARNIEEYPGEMKYKVVVIDEFGDLIVSKHKVAKMVETDDVYLSGELKGKHKMKKETTDISGEIASTILRLAQKARAAGIHIIIATQRPSTDIITGSIKANFPTKVAFRTAKEVDSRILLDETGADKLLGKGDMIFSSDDGMIRLQGFNV